MAPGSSTAGRLLIATPAINDGNFDRSVIFMLHHDDVGALGVIINRASELAVDELLPRWADLINDPPFIFNGGPVEPNGFIGVAETYGETPEHSAVVAGDSRLVTLDLEGDPALVAGQVSRLRIFRGYAGWGPGQLDGEISHGAWFTIEPTDDDLWTDRPEDLCERVLGRQKGSLRWFANAPSDPSVN